MKCADPHVAVELEYDRMRHEMPKAWSDAEVRRLYVNSPELHSDVPSFAAFARLVRAIEAAHGISMRKAAR